jgi:hypothetical protein
MTKHEKIANIIAFLSILFGEDDEMKTIMKFNPNYILEKYERYVESTRVEYPWGMHPSLRNQVFQRYVDKWKLELKENSTDE